jgi:hypothetical protein
MPDTPNTAATTKATGVVRRTRAALGRAAERRDSRTVFLVVGTGYLLLYLVTVGNLSFVDGGAGALTIRFARDAARAFASVGFFRFDAVALVSVGGVTYLFSPLNLLVGAFLSTLVGANGALTYLALVQPRACGIEASSGVFAGIPALLSGAACCGPTILLVVGVQASATLVTGFQLLVPVAVLLLVASLLLMGRTVDPTLL